MQPKHYTTLRPVLAPWSQLQRVHESRVSHRYISIIITVPYYDLISIIYSTTVHKVFSSKNANGECGFKTCLKSFFTGIWRLLSETCGFAFCCLHSYVDRLLTGGCYMDQHSLLWFSCLVSEAPASFSMLISQKWTSIRASAIIQHVGWEFYWN